jgi:hypothetical protein
LLLQGKTLRELFVPTVLKRSSEERKTKQIKKRDSSPLTHFCRQDADFGRKSWPHKDYLRIYTLAGVSRSY